jgi:uncharacterized sulfatase
MRRLAQVEAVQLAQGRPRSAFTPAQRSLVAPSKPAEELYDLADDPHEMNNLAQDSRYEEVVQRFRSQLSSWQQQCGDLGLIPEDELIGRWRPDGSWPAVKPPRLAAGDGRKILPSETPGASLVWTPDAGATTSREPAAPSPFGAAEGDPRQWRLLAGLTPVPAEEHWVRAVRAGYLPSAAVHVPAAPTGRAVGMP